MWRLALSNFTARAQTGITAVKNRCANHSNIDTFCECVCGAFIVCAQCVHSVCIWSWCIYEHKHKTNILLTYLAYLSCLLTLPKLPLPMTFKKIKSPGFALKYTSLEKQKCQKKPS